MLRLTAMPKRDNGEMAENYSRLEHSACQTKLWLPLGYGSTRWFSEDPPPSTTSLNLEMSRYLQGQPISQPRDRPTSQVTQKETGHQGEDGDPFSDSGQASRPGQRASGPAGQRARLPGSQAPRLPSSQAPRLPGSQAPRLPSSQATSLPGYQPPRLPRLPRLPKLPRLPRLPG